jgi:D-arabinose 1-dehydrogenase-like Zn-dependent alcohol dehydrogenase
MPKMRAVVVSKPGAPFEVVEREVPEPGQGHVRIKVEACGVCHSDAIVKFAAFPGMKLPRVPGHEVAGRIDAVGSGVTQWKAGDRVGVGWHGGHCFECIPCRRGQFINCEKEQICGITYDGGYAEYTVVPSAAVARIPDQLTAVEAGPLLCAGVTTFNALRNAGMRSGDTVAIQGIGGLGHLGVQYAAKMGFRTVAISSGGDKEALARKLGAHEYVDTAKVGAAEGLQRLGGADLVLATAPHAAAMESVIGGLKARGTLLVVAVPSDPLPVPVMSILYGKRIQGWPSGTALDSEETMSFSALTGVRPRTETFKLEQAEEAFAHVMQNKVRFRGVLVP